jgi:hypothetical protein
MLCSPYNICLRPSRWTWWASLSTPLVPSGGRLKGNMARQGKPVRQDMLLQLNFLYRRANSKTVSSLAYAVQYSAYTRIWILLDISVTHILMSLFNWILNDQVSVTWSHHTFFTRATANCHRANIASDFNTGSLIPLGKWRWKFVNREGWQ